MEETVTTEEYSVVRQEGGRQVQRNLKHYDLDAIIVVGYPVKSYQATQFRIWATKTLQGFIIKAFVLDDERLKQGCQFFGKMYLFDGYLIDSLPDSCRRDVIYLNIKELIILSLFDGCLIGRTLNAFVPDICPNMGNKIFCVNSAGHKI